MSVQRVNNWSDKMEYKLERYQAALFKKLGGIELSGDYSRELLSERQEGILGGLTIRTSGVDVPKKID